MTTASRESRRTAEKSASQSERRARERKLAAALALAFGLSGCGLLPPEYQKIVLHYQKQLNKILFVSEGGKPPEVAGATAPSGADAPTGATPAKSGEFATDAAGRAKANAELLHEMFRVVFNREPKDRSEFGSYVDTLNQGASLEGIYNGFVHSSDFRAIEVANPGSTPEALRIFAEELAVFEGELPVKTSFDARSAKPLAKAIDPGEAIATDEGGKKVADGVAVVEFGKEKAAASPAPAAAPGDTAAPGDAKAAAAKALADQYARTFAGASIFTLKRVLGDEAMKVITAKKEKLELYSAWYARWVVHMAARNVDFGIAARNKADEQFHYKWALTAGEDRCLWEVLNRVHRLMNEANKQKKN